MRSWLKAWGKADMGGGGCVWMCVCTHIHVHVCASAHTQVCMLSVGSHFRHRESWEVNTKVSHSCDLDYTTSVALHCTFASLRLLPFQKRASVFCPKNKYPLKPNQIVHTLPKGLSKLYVLYSATSKLIS